MTKKDMKPGLRILVPDVHSSGEVSKAVVVGYDPTQDAWVASCPDWTMKLSHLDDDDYAAMEPDNG